MSSLLINALFNEMSEKDHVNIHYIMKINKLNPCFW